MSKDNSVYAVSCLMLLLH